MAATRTNAATRKAVTRRTVTRSTVRTRILDAFGAAGQPLATVYLPSRSSVADAEDRFEIRHGNVLSRLEELAAPGDLVTVVDEALAGHSHADGAGLVLVAGTDGLVFEHSTIRPVARTEVSIGSTPRLLPLLRAVAADIDHVAVLLDRTGADLWIRDGLGDPLFEDSVEGQSIHVHRGKPGGWSQRRFQQRAENTWESNAKLVVEELLADLPDGTDLIVAGGDVRAVGFFAEHLPERLELETVDGSRAADHDAFLDAADLAVRSVAAARLADRIGEVRDMIGEGRGMAGADVLDLLTQGRVKRLYVADDTFADDRPSAPFDFSVPIHCPPGYEGDCVAVPVTEGAVALAVATGAEVTLLPSAPLTALGGVVAAETRS